MLGKNTVLVFSSDNGGSAWFGGSSFPYRGSQGTPLEGGVRAPAFLLDMRTLTDERIAQLRRDLDNPVYPPVGTLPQYPHTIREPHVRVDLWVSMLHDSCMDGWLTILSQKGYDMAIYSPYYGFMDTVCRITNISSSSPLTYVPHLTPIIQPFTLQTPASTEGDGSASSSASGPGSGHSSTGRRSDNGNEITGTIYRGLFHITDWYVDEWGARTREVLYMLSTEGGGYQRVFSLCFYSSLQLNPSNAHPTLPL